MSTTKKRRPRRLHYEYWRSRSNGDWYGHIRSGKEIVFPTEGLSSEREVLKPIKMLTKFFADETNVIIAWIEDPHAEKDAGSSPPLYGADRD